MTELEQLRADLATLKETSKIYLGAYGYFPAHHDLLIKLTKEKIADLEAQQEPADFDWDEVQRAVRLHLQSGGHNVKAVAQYVRHLESKIAKLEEEINTSEFTWMATHAARLLKERDDALAKVAELENKLAKRAVSQVADAIVKEMDEFKNREKLAELTTIANAIPPACGLAREIVEKWIEGVKKEMQR